MLYAIGMGSRELAKYARTEERKRTTGGVAVALLLGAMTLTGCDFSVSNPGPVADPFLDDAGAHQAIINGAQRELNYAIGVVGMDDANRTREFSAGDVNPWEGVSYEGFLGIATSNVPGYLDPWGPTQAARWITNDATRRFEEVGANNDVRTQAHLWGGFALRILGERYCEVVFDGAGAVPNTEALTRAELRFSDAISGGGSAETTMAATAGRASIRVSQGNWSGAVSDANQVPDDFKFALDYHGGGAWRYYNWFVQGGGLSGGGAYTVWNTHYVDYYLETGDPRTPWVDTGVIQSTSFTEMNVTEFPYYAQTKYTEMGDDIDLVTGTEMRLIEAEALLRGGDMDGAMVKINHVRALAGMDPWAPAPVTIEDAWAYLKRERGIDMWLEGRRLADLRRWRADSSPGALHPLENGIGPNGGPDLTNRALCLPIPDDEVDQNENLTP